RESGLVRFKPGNTFFLFGSAIVHNAEPTNQWRKGQALKDQRNQDNHESQKDDKVVHGHQCRVLRKWKGERGGERNHAAHTGPPHNRDVLPRRVRIAGAKTFEQETRQVCGRKDPKNSQQYDNDADTASVQEKLGDRIPRKAGSDFAQLKTDKQENEAVQKK